MKKNRASQLFPLGFPRTGAKYASRSAFVTSQAKTDLKEAGNRHGARDELADHGIRRSGLFRRWRISLPVLKNGTDFFCTDTCAPVRGLRPVRAGRVLIEKAPKPRSSTRSPRAIAAMTSSRMALTMFSTSRWYKCGFCEICAARARI